MSADWKSGCNFKVCVHARFTGQGWEAYADLYSGISYGHLDVFGPDHITHHSGKDQPWGSTDRTLTYRGTGTGQVCAEGWYRRPDGSYLGQGEPCVTL
ncbi:hypothetical protein [Kribbella sp. NPDC048928]|uniref:hypothetical protein n=1 Tax=Kribbella sp. NPDC048928 TaxID=3364111 RepID=UPI00371E091F